MPGGGGIERDGVETVALGLLLLFDVPSESCGDMMIGTSKSGRFNRPGPRIADSAELLGALLHPDGFPVPAGSAAVRWQ